MLIKNLRNKLRLTHISSNFKKTTEIEEEKKFYEDQREMAERFERYLKITDPVVEIEEERQVAEIEEVGERREKKKEREEL